MNKTIKGAFLLSKTEYIKWISNARVIILAILTIFLYIFIVDPLEENALLMKEKLNILEPLIASMNSGVVLMILPLSFLVLIADYPKIDNTTIFYIYRIGRINWFLGQILTLVLISLTLNFIVILSTVTPALYNGYWGDEWSRVVENFSTFFPERIESYSAKLIPKNLYNQISVYNAAVLSCFMTNAYFLIIGQTFLLFSLINKKIIGFIICTTFILTGTVLCSINSKLMWALPTANSIVCIHYTEYFREPIIPIGFSLFYLCVLAVLLFTACMIVAPKINYNNFV